VSDLLAGTTVVLVGTTRPMMAAARWYADLGATVRVKSTATPDLADRLWLGDHAQVRGDVVANLRIIEHGADEHGVTAPVTVRYSSTGETAPNSHQTLDERELAAVGGVAVAIGSPDRPPLPLPEGCLDHMVGTHIAGAGLLALFAGTAEVEVAAVDVAAWAVATNANLYLPYGSPWYRAGRRASGSGGGYPYSVFDVADGQFCLIGRTTADWESLVRAMGSPTWATEQRYNDRRAMGRDYPQEVDDRLAPWLGSHTRDELLVLAAEFGFPAGPLRTPAEVLSMPSMADRWRPATVDGTDARSPGEPFDVVSTSGAEPPPPLDGLFVLDLSWVWSGPAVGTALADVGATVLKVESSTRPDNTRLRGRSSAAAVSAEAPSLELTPYFHAVNRGKHSVALNLTTSEGRAALARLADQADIIIENLSPGVMTRLGVAPRNVHATNPSCVYLSMRGYREHPSTAGLRAYAPVLSGGAGVESLVAYPGEAPIGMMTFGLSDANAASQGLLLALAGLCARRAHGSGAAIMLSQSEAATLANGRNLVRTQLGSLESGLQPLNDDDSIVTREKLPSAPWTSADLFSKVSTRWVGELEVARLPWRQNGEFPTVRGAGPELGQDTASSLTERLGMTASDVAEGRKRGAYV